MFCGLTAIMIFFNCSRKACANLARAFYHFCIKVCEIIFLRMLRGMLLTAQDGSYGVDFGVATVQ